MGTPGPAWDPPRLLNLQTKANGTHVASPSLLAGLRASPRSTSAAQLLRRPPWRPVWGRELWALGREGGSISATSVAFEMAATPQKVSPQPRGEGAARPGSRGPPAPMPATTPPFPTQSLPSRVPGSEPAGPATEPDGPAGAPAAKPVWGCPQLPVLVLLEGRPVHRGRLYFPGNAQIGSRDGSNLCLKLSLELGRLRCVQLPPRTIRKPTCPWDLGPPRRVDRTHDSEEDALRANAVLTLS